MPNDRISRVKRLQTFLANVVREEPVEGENSKLQRFAQFWIFVARSFTKNRCPVRASALSYTTLLALVPLLAIAVSVSASLLREKGSKEIEKLINTVIAKVAPQLDLVSSDESGVKDVAEKISGFIGRIQTGALNASATVALVFIAISLLSTIEATMNDIWGAKRGRNWLVRVVQYWTAITLGSVLLAVAVGAASGPYLDATKGFLNFAPFLGSVLFQFLPFIVLCITFSLFYQLIPNTTVHWKGAFVGGFVAALLWQLNGSLNVLYVSQVARQSAIYGGLGILPVFLIGLYFSWLIFLFGAQVSYAYQNRNAYFQEQQADAVNQRGREFIGVRSAVLIADRFHRGESPPTALEIAESLGVPSRLISRVLDLLLRSQILVEANVTRPGTTFFGREAKTHIGYAPARPLQAITVADILDALRSAGGRELETKMESFHGVVTDTLEKITRAEKQVSGSLTLAHLAQRIPD